MNFLISNAHAAAQPASQGGGMEGIILMLGMFVIFYFLLIRPQQKRAKEHRKLVEALSKGDEVITNGGILGKITEVSELYVSLEIANNVQIRMQRMSISSVLPKGSIKASEKD